MASIEVCCCGDIVKPPKRKRCLNENGAVLFPHIFHGVENYLLDERSSNLTEAEHGKLAEMLFPAMLKKICYVVVNSNFEEISSRRSALIDAKLNLEIIEAMINSVNVKLELQTADTDQQAAAKQSRMSRYNIIDKITSMFFFFNFWYQVQ